MTDDQSIRSIALDYIEGWYMADGARMKSALSPHLAKRRIVSQDEIWHVDKAWMVQATEEWPWQDPRATQRQEGHHHLRSNGNDGFCEDRV